ncbi:hypothetical protein ADEAN_000958300 [Angomonas deanei]|uniref:C2H2-type domain-containing protein n=1 Tax=Angomonas deanei TaxID=59799 RepID=A0A7G2CSS6_9TRYP|nr:hypothetical protein ADEAN_000958300 [Angomonas deanei]
MRRGRILHRCVPALCGVVSTTCAVGGYRLYRQPLVTNTAARFYASSPVTFAPKQTSLYQCGECGKAFRLINALNHHIMTRHAGNAKIMVENEGKLEEYNPSMASTASTTPAASESPKETVPTPSVTAKETTSSPQEESAGSVDQTDGDTAQEKSVFVCTICQKTFRIEAALVHHYHAKHNMEMPTARSGDTSQAAETPSADGETSPSGPAGEEYVRVGEGALPQEVHYHLDVAPNAPEEGDVAVHARCVNQHVLLGKIQEIEEGYVFEEKVLQFTLVTDFDNPSRGDPEKDFHLVRVYEESFWKPLKEQMNDGDFFFVSGRLRLVPQYDASTKKYYHFPVVQVHPGSGTVHKV